MLRSIAAWWTPRRRAVAIVLAGWALLVVVGAGRAARSDEWLAVPDLSGLLLAVGAVYAILAMALIIYLRPRRRTAAGPRRTLDVRALIIATLLALLIGLGLSPPEDGAETSTATTAPPLTIAPETGGLSDGSGDRTQSRDIALLLLIGLGAAGVLLLSRRRTTRGTPAESTAAGPELAAELAPAVEEAIERLGDGSDARLAVMAAYASLEQALEQHGRPRRPAETPTEHIAAVLAAVPVIAQPALQLGKLYEIARFSDHPITEGDRDRAAAALEAARHTLSGTMEPAP